MPAQENNLQPARQRSNRTALGLIFFVMLMDVMGITMLSPVAPQIVLRYSREAVGVTMITMLYACGQVIAAPLIGKLGDRYGRRPVLLLSVLGQALGYLLFGLGGSIWMLYLGRLVGGITAGNLSTAGAYIADVSSANERSKNFTIISLAWSLGLIFGPALGGIFGQLSLEAPAFAAAAFSLVNVVLGFFILPESLPVERRQALSISLRDFNPLAAILDIARKPGLGKLMLASTLFNFAFNGVVSTSALFVIEKFSAGTSQISLMMILGGSASALSNAFLVRRVIPRLGEQGSGMYGLVGLSIFYTLIFFAPYLWLVYPINMLASVMNSFIFPVLTSLSANRVEPNEIGKLMGVITAVSSLMNIFGPLWAGLVYDHVMLGAPYWMGAIIMLFTAYMFSRISQPAPAPSIR